MKLLKLTNSYKKTLVDDEDFKTLSKFTWYLGKSGYPETRLKKIYGRKLVRIHNLIIPNKSSFGLFVDHKNMNRLDNRRENLRYATKAQNMMNRGAPKSNTSGFKGVTWDEPNKKWLAQIYQSGKCIKIGRFKVKKEAAFAYNNAALKLHGEFAYLNLI